MTLRFRAFGLMTIALLLVLSLSVEAAVIRVKWNSRANGPGTDWNHAFKTVSGALERARSGDEIWVAGSSAHPYYERVTLKRGVSMYGGFSGKETSRSSRSWRSNSTILDGRGFGVVVTAASGASTSTVLDGFIIRNGSTGVRCSFSSPLIANNTVSGNRKEGIDCENSSATIAGNTITRNHEEGIDCERSRLTVTNNRITMNHEEAIDCDRCKLTLRGNTISGNGEDRIDCG